MSKRFFKTIAVASTITITLLGGAGKLVAMWDGVPEETVKHVVRQHALTHGVIYDRVSPITIKLENPQGYQEYKRYCEQCSMCVQIVKEKKTGNVTLERLLVLEDVVKDTPKANQAEVLVHQLEAQKNEIQNLLLSNQVFQNRVQNLELELEATNQVISSQKSRPLQIDQKKNVRNLSITKEPLEPMGQGVRTWGDIDENTRYTLALHHHTLHPNPSDSKWPPRINAVKSQLSKMKHGDWEEFVNSCPLCVENATEFLSINDLQNRLLNIENTFGDMSQVTPNLLLMVQGLNEEIHRIKNEIGLTQQLAPSLLPRDQEEQIKIPASIPALKKLEEENKAPAIFHAHLDAAEDKGRKEEKREIAKKLITEKMNDEMILRIIGVTEDDLVELKRTILDKK